MSLFDANITYSAVRNPRWNDPEKKFLFCEVNFDHIDSEEFSPFVAVASGDYPHTHKIFAECVSGKWGAVGDYVPPEKPSIERVINQLKLHRNKLLAETDWTQSLDTPEAKRNAFAVYRQQLRDFTKAPGFPWHNVVAIPGDFDLSKAPWPVKPE